MSEQSDLDAAIDAAEQHGRDDGIMLPDAEPYLTLPDGGAWPGTVEVGDVTAYEYRVLRKSGADSINFPADQPLIDAAVAEAGRVYLDWLWPSLGPHRVERRPYRPDSGWEPLCP